MFLSSNHKLNPYRSGSTRVNGRESGWGQEAVNSKREDGNLDKTLSGFFLKRVRIGEQQYDNMLTKTELHIAHIL